MERSLATGERPSRDVDDDDDKSILTPGEDSQTLFSPLRQG